MGPGFTARIRRCYEEHREGLIAYALSISGDRDQAEDAIQFAFFRLLQRGRMPRELRPYLFRSVRNAVIDGARRARSSAGGAPEGTSADRTTDDDPVRDRFVSQCLSRLPDQEREVVVLKIYAGLTFAEIGDLDGTSVNTVASRYRRGLERLRAQLGGEG